MKNRLKIVVFAGLMVASGVTVASEDGTTCPPKQCITPSCRQQVKSLKEIYETYKDLPEKVGGTTWKGVLGYKECALAKQAAIEFLAALEKLAENKNLTESQRANLIEEAYNEAVEKGLPIGFGNYRSTDAIKMWIAMGKELIDIGVFKEPDAVRKSLDQAVRDVVAITKKHMVILGVSAGLVILAIGGAKIVGVMNDAAKGSSLGDPSSARNAEQEYKSFLSRHPEFNNKSAEEIRKAMLDESVKTLRGGIQRIKEEQIVASPGVVVSDPALEKYYELYPSARSSSRPPDQDELERIREEMRAKAAALSDIYPESAGQWSPPMPPSSAQQQPTPPAEQLPQATTTESPLASPAASSTQAAKALDQGEAEYQRFVKELSEKNPHYRTRLTREQYEAIKEISLTNLTEEEDQAINKAHKRTVKGRRPTLPPSSAQQQLTPPAEQLLQATTTESPLASPVTSSMQAERDETILGPKDEAAYQKKREELAERIRVHGYPESFLNFFTRKDFKAWNDLPGGNIKYYLDNTGRWRPKL